MLIINILKKKISIVELLTKKYQIMKKIIYLFLTVSLIFSSCKKEEDEVVTPTVISGCTDSQATNYSSNATNDDSSCLYDISAVWETTSAILNGEEMLGQTVDLDLTYIFADGQIGAEGYYDGLMTSYAIGTAVSSSSDPNAISWSGTVYLPDGSELDMSFSFNVDFMTSYNNMTWRYVNYPSVGDTYVKTLVRSTAYSLSDWK